MELRRPKILSVLVDNYLGISVWILRLEKDGLTLACALALRHWGRGSWMGCLRGGLPEGHGLGHSSPLSEDVGFGDVTVLAVMRTCDPRPLRLSCPQPPHWMVRCVRGPVGALASFRGMRTLEEGPGPPRGPASRGFLCRAWEQHRGNGVRGQTPHPSVLILKCVGRFLLWQALPCFEFRPVAVYVCFKGFFTAALPYSGIHMTPGRKVFPSLLLILQYLLILNISNSWAFTQVLCSCWLQN